MIRINLLPVRRRRVEETIRKEVSVFFLLILLSAAVMGYFHMGQNRRIEQLDQEKRQINEDMLRHRGRQRELRELEKKKKILLQKLEVIDNLKSHRNLLVRVLDELATRVPSEKIWLRRLDQQGSSLTIEGVARGNETIAQFMEALSSSPYIGDDNVVLKQSRQEVIQGYKLKAFQLTCRIVTPKVKTASKEEKKKA